MIRKRINKSDRKRVKSGKYYQTLDFKTGVVELKKRQGKSADMSGSIFF